MVRNIQEIKNPGASNHFEQLVGKCLGLLSIDLAAVTAIGVLEVEPASCVVKMLKKWTKWKKQQKMVKNGNKNCQNSFQAIYNHNHRS